MTTKNGNHGKANKNDLGIKNYSLNKINQSKN